MATTNGGNCERCGEPMRTDSAGTFCPNLGATAHQIANERADRAQRYNVNPRDYDSTRVYHCARVIPGHWTEAT